MSNERNEWAANNKSICFTRGAIVTEKPTQLYAERPSSEDYEEDEINLIDLLMVLLKHKKIIFWITFAAGVLSIIYSLLVTPIYTATARVLPPPQHQCLHQL